MNQQEIREFFGALEERKKDAHGDTDSLFVQLMADWDETRGSIAIHIMRRYKKSYTESFRRRILKYVSLLLLNPELVRQKDKIILAGPTVVIPHFGEIKHVLAELAELDEYESIYAPVLYKLGIKAANDDAPRYLLILREILEFPNVYKIFAREYAWGLDYNEYNCYMSFDYEHDEQRTRPELRQGEVCRSAIVDPFLEHFIYGKNEEGCPLLLDREPYQLRELGLSITKAILDYQYDLYALLLRLIKKDPLIKRNLIRWLRVVYVKNKERNKMMFDRQQFISDGYAFNLNGVLSNFSRGIVSKGIDDFDVAWFVDEPLVDLRGRGCEGAERSSTEEGHFTFQTAVFFSKVIFGNLSFTKMLENMNDLSMRLSYLSARDAALSRVMQSMMCAYRIILHSEISTAEEPFLQHMSQYALRHPVPEIFLTFYLNLGEFLVNSFGFDPSPELCARILESADFNLHSKMPVVKIIFYSKIKVDCGLLVKFYTDVEKMDAEERKAVRYYLNRILADYDVHSVKFVSCALSDLESLLSTGLGALVELKKKHDPKMVQQAKSSFFCLGELFRLLRSLIDRNPSLFLEKEILPQFVTILNYNLKIIVGPKCSELKCPESGTNIGFEPKTFLREMLMFYMHMHKHSDDFLVAVVKDTMYFNLSLLKRALKICDTKFILSSDELDELGSMTKKAEALVSDNVEDDLVVPEQFIDPVTCMPMKEPVRLKTSNATIDKSTFDMLLMTSGIDPFNREVLDKDGYVVDEALKRELDEYWSSRT